MLDRYRMWRFDRALQKDVIPEIEVAAQCEHGCFQLVSASPILWRFAGMDPVVARPPRKVMIHGVHCSAESDHGFCRALCWDGAA